MRIPGLDAYLATVERSDRFVVAALDHAKQEIAEVAHKAMSDAYEAITEGDIRADVAEVADYIYESLCAMCSAYYPDMDSTLGPIGGDPDEVYDLYREAAVRLAEEVTR